MTQVQIQFLGHAGILIQSEQLKLVVDANFSSRIPFIRRVGAVAPVPFESLQKVQAIFYTNAHHHRLDVPSLRCFKQTTQIFTPLEVASVIPSMFQFHRTEFKDGAEIEVGDIKVKAIKGLHRAFRKSGLRYPLSLNYLFKVAGKTVFYCSDTRYDGAYFYDLGQEHKIDLAILPIDHVGPDQLATNRYMDLHQALQAFQDLKAAQMLPVCYGAFNFSARSSEAFLENFRTEVNRLQLAERVLILEPFTSLFL